MLIIILIGKLRQSIEACVNNHSDGQDVWKNYLSLDHRRRNRGTRSIELHFTSYIHKIRIVRSEMIITSSVAILGAEFVGIFEKDDTWSFNFRK